MAKFVTHGVRSFNLEQLVIVEDQDHKNRVVMYLYFPNPIESITLVGLKAEPDHPAWTAIRQVRNFINENPSCSPC